MLTPSQMLDQVSDARYLAAFRAVEHEITENQRALLLAHYQAPGRTVTATELAHAIGLQYFGPVNLQYGQLASKLNKALKVDLGDRFKVNVLVTFDEAGPEITWIMRRQVAAALEALGWCRTAAKLAGGSVPSEVEISGTYSGGGGPERFRVTLSGREVMLDVVTAAGREAAFRQTVEHASGLAQQTLNDLYRQLVLGNYTRLDGQAGNAARNVLDQLYPDQGMLPGFELKSGTYNAAGLVVYNLLQHPEPAAIGYRILTTILERLLQAGILDAPHLDDRLDLLQPFMFPEEVPAALLVEGAVRQVRVNAYERNPEARRRCIEHYGARCVVCDFDFAQFYGPSMVDYIHVHHLRPLAKIGVAYEVDPIRDLRPVCPNCHSVIHNEMPALTVEAVRALIQAARQKHGVA